MEWRRTVRDHTALSLIMLDVDHFKLFNDTYGHGAGDECLRLIAAALKRVVQRPGDMVARYGGEEFAVILANTNQHGAMKISEDIGCAVQNLSIQHSANLEGKGLVSVSIGVATAWSNISGAVSMPPSLFRAADTALYEAKNSGRNRAVASAPLLAE